ncbi:MAG: VOC family protein [Candidatus Paceibacterota bacterium]|jgi:predicted 3-demethylubiquinone-9 3-methyltransferase (glyoxalase superfamily)|nr:VOC family protein [Candidatus Paceibacterota bacterium]
MKNQKIIPHLWYDKEAKEAAQFYTSIFPNSKITHTSVLHDTPSGDAEVVNFEIMGYSFMSISAGPYFKFNPSISFMVNFDPSRDKNAKSQLDEIWKKLSDGGKVLMPLDAYPFSKHYGWTEDKYGLSWQLILTDPAGEERPPIIPSLMFTGDVSGKAKEATDFYLSVFENTKRGTLATYPAGSEPEAEGTVMFTDFMLEGQWFTAMDSALPHGFGFNEAVSLMVNCDSQDEIDRYWKKLSADPKAEQCGWLKDVYGVSWQISPNRLGEMMREGTPDQVERVTKAFLEMKKFDIETLEKAYSGENADPKPM